MEKNMSDPWKRPSAVDDAADVMSGYERQLEIQLNKTVEATPEEVEKWQEKELDWWAEKQLSFVAVASIIQLSALGLMFLVMFLIKVGVK
tara:strand:- start:2703 stop:2972 length:270 start_codon:yes stop_codon:yes gene_type:complete